MTEPATDETTTDTATTEPAGSSQTPDQQGEQTEEGREGGNREAAKYRTALRAAEAQRAILTATVTRLQTAAAERVAAEHLAAPDDLWRFGGSLADVLDDAGDVDPDRVAGQVAALLDQRPGLAKGVRLPQLDLGQGVRGTTSGGASWQGLLQGRK